MPVHTERRKIHREIETHTNTHTHTEERQIELTDEWFQPAVISYVFYNCIVLYILGPTACWCPLSPHFLTGWVSRLLGLAQVSWATTRVVSIAFSPSPSISRCISIHSSPAIGFHLCFFFTTDVSAPIRSTHHLLMVSFQAWDRLWYLLLWSQRRSTGCAWSRNLVSNSALAGVWTSDLAV